MQRWEKIKGNTGKLQVNNENKTKQNKRIIISKKYQLSRNYCHFLHDYTPWFLKEQKENKNHHKHYQNMKAAVNYEIQQVKIEDKCSDKNM